MNLDRADADLAYLDRLMTCARAAHTLATLRAAHDDDAGAAAALRTMAIYLRTMQGYAAESADRTTDALNARCEQVSA